MFARNTAATTLLRTMWFRYKACPLDQDPDELIPRCSPGKEPSFT